MKANLARLRHNNCGLDYGTINEVDVAEKVDLYALNKRYFSLIITPLFSEFKAKFEMEEIISQLLEAFHNQETISMALNQMWRHAI